MGKMMDRKKITYYCYNGKRFPDISNSVLKWKDSGICFQNKDLGSSIFEEEIVYDRFK